MLKIKVIVLILLIVVVIVSLYFFFKDEEVVLKDLKGLTTTEAKGYATRNNIILIVEKEYSNEVKKGKIIRQSKKEGSIIKENTKLIVYVSKGKK